MSKKHHTLIEEKIHSTLKACISKMADHLLKTFNPQSKESLMLFRQFCSALKTRMQWIKDSAKTFEEIKNIFQRVQESGQHAQNPAQSNSNWLERLLNSENSNSPLRPKDLKNGLVMTT